MTTVTRAGRRRLRRHEQLGIALLTVASLIVGGFVAVGLLGSSHAAPTHTAALGEVPVRIASAGDIGGSANEDRPVSDQIVALNPAADIVLIPGDVVYPDGEASGFTSFFDQTWGRFRSKIIATPGNHDYHTSGGSGFFAYFTDPIPRGVDIGNGWRVEVVNCEIACGAGSAQEVAVKADAQAHHTEHLILLVHEPRFTGGSSHGPYTGLTAIWNDLATNGGEFAIAGHNHVYERFAYLNGAGSPDVNGMRQFVAGTGGNGLYTVSPKLGEEAFQFTEHGALILDLYSGSYSWEFRATDGSLMDSGTQVTKQGGPPPPTTSSSSSTTSSTSSTSTTSSSTSSTTSATSTTSPTTSTSTTTTTLPGLHVNVDPSTTVHCTGGTFTAGSNDLLCVPTPPPPPPPPPTAGCDGKVFKTYTGTQSGTTRPGTIPAGQTILATGANWTGKTTYPITFGAGDGACWKGGTVTGTWPGDVKWSTLHSTGAINVKPGVNTTIRDLRVTGYGDSYRIEDKSPGWSLLHVFADNGHDDCVEDDWLFGGTISDSMFAGCYVGISTRPFSTSIPDGSARTITIQRTFIRLKPIIGVYSGKSPGTGGWFKDDTRSPKIVLQDVGLRADGLPNHQSLLPPAKIVACNHLLIMWGNKTTPFPYAAQWKVKCPDVVIKNGQEAIDLWNALAAAWHA